MAGREVERDGDEWETFFFLFFGYAWLAGWLAGMAGYGGFFFFALLCVGLRWFGSIYLLCFVSLRCTALRCMELAVEVTGARCDGGESCTVVYCT